jgi:hypothetical protein
MGGIGRGKHHGEHTSRERKRKERESEKEEKREERVANQLGGLLASRLRFLNASSHINIYFIPPAAG